MKILILGGTRFIGRHLVNSARARRHEVMLFNRGRTNPDLFQKVKKIRGDRERDLDQLSGRWDAVVDTCGYLPRIVNLSARALKDKAGQYVFVSSISAYANFGSAGIRESDALGTLADEAIEEITGETYGPLKALCERKVQEAFGINSLIIRPGLVVGPHDPTDRFTYWVSRIARGGDVLAPDRPDAPAQFIDARDLADFVIHLIEHNVSGVFNVAGETVSFETIFQTCKLVSGSDANFKWAPAEFLQQQRVEPWSDMPMWLHDAGEYAGFARVDVSKAVNAGLKFTALSETVKDTLAWVDERAASQEWKSGLSQTREQELLELLKNVQ